MKKSLNILTFLAIVLLTVLLGMPFELFAQSKAKNALDGLKYKQGQEKLNDVRAVKTELLVAKSEKKAIRQVKNLIRKYRGMAVEADMQFRLAELYMRRAKAERFFELNRKSDFVVELDPQLIKKASSKRMIRKAIKIYDLISRRFPNFDKIDVVTFNNAFARQQLGQTKSAEKLYWKVVSKYSFSILVPDSHLAIGEMAFRAKKFKYALNHFDAIKKYPNSRVYPYGLYKAAWTHYNLHDALSGISELEGVVDFGKRVAKLGLNARLDLRKEALSDMVLFFSDVYKSKDANKYFSKQANKQEYGALIMRLANLYSRHSKYNDVRIVLTDYIDDNKKDALIPELNDKLVWNYEHQKNRKLAVEQLTKFHKLCAEKSSWIKFQSKVDPKAGLSCLSKVHATSIKLARKWLRIWKKNPTHPKFADVAELAFEHYIHRNLDVKKTNEARYAYAELLFKRKKFRKASASYSLVAKNTKLKKIGHDSRYAAIVSLEKSVKNKWNSKDENLYTKLAGSYVKNHPNGKYRLDIEFKMGLIAYEKNRFDEAAPIFMALGDKYANKAKGLKAQDLYLDILNHNKDYKALKEYAHKLLSKNVKGKRVSKLSKIYQQSYFLQVQDLEAKGDYKQAISEYKSFAKINKGTLLAEKALWNAMQLHYKLDDISGGTVAAENYYNKFPKSKDAKSALLKAAESYESMGQPKSAAKVLRKLSKLDKAASSKWLNLAAEFNYISGNLALAKSQYKILNKSSDSGVAFHALLKLKDIAEKSNDREYRRLLKVVIASGRQPQASEAKLYFVEETFNNKNYTKAFIDAKKVLNMGSKASAKAKSKAKFIQAQILELEFDRQSVKSRIDRFTLVFSIKTERLQKAQKAYQAAIRYGDPDTAVISLMRLSKLYKKYVEMLKTVPVPQGLPQNDVAAFRAEMNKLVLPMEDKSVDTMLEALNQAKRLGLRDGRIAEVQWELDQLNLKLSPKPIVKYDEPEISVPRFLEVGS